MGFPNYRMICECMYYGHPKSLKIGGHSTKYKKLKKVSKDIYNCAKKVKVLYIYICEDRKVFSKIFWCKKTHHQLKFECAKERVVVKFVKFKFDYFFVRIGYEGELQLDRRNLCAGLTFKFLAQIFSFVQIVLLSASLRSHE